MMKMMCRSTSSGCRSSILYPLLLLILHLVSHHTTLCVCIDPRYTSCKPFRCGSQTIKYPFYVERHQPAYCGAIAGYNNKKMMITCSSGDEEEEEQPIIHLSGDPYLITHISYDEQILHVVNTALLNHSTSSSSQLSSCPGNSIHNLTASEYFNFDEMMRGTREILLLQNCTQQGVNRIVPPPRSSSSSTWHRFNGCSNSSSGGGGGGSRNVSLAVYAEDLKAGGSREVCDGVISVRYDYDAGAAAVRGEKKNVLEDLRRGIDLKWVVAYNCTYCDGSGGRCGYEANTLEFKCFCADRPHRGSCNHPDVAPAQDSTGRNSSKKRGLGIILGTVFGAAAILLVIMHILLWRHRKIKQQQRQQGLFTTHDPRNIDRSGSHLETNSMHYGVPLFSYGDLKDATNNFDAAKELGEGGFGVVYHGVLKDGREVAVKRLYEKNYKRIEQFINEIQILTSLRHKNLVTLYGCTSRHSRELLLVYEYVPNKTVADHLHHHNDPPTTMTTTTTTAAAAAAAAATPPPPLTWGTRMKIAIETASALSYLHASDIIHRDVKTNNILLDNDFTVKVADFGLSRLFPSDVTHVSTAPQGTPGYVDPEYYQCYHLTDKSDVYSFGVVLTELISSLPAVDTDRQRHEINLSNYAMNRIHCCAFSELVDPKLGFDSDFRIKRMATLVAELAFQCLQHERELRPSMQEVLDALKRIDGADYSVLEAEEQEKRAGGGRTRRSTGSSAGTGSSKKKKPPISPASSSGLREDDDDGLVRNHNNYAHQAPRSPDTVMEKWISRNTTPNTSGGPGGGGG